MNCGTILFAAGRGGSPARHVETIELWRERGFTVTTPEFPMLASMHPTAEELLGRVEAMSAALDETDSDGLVTGVGHSIGATLLLAMAGAQIWLGPGQRLDIATDPRIARIAMLAPPVGFFGAPQALDAVALPILLRSGGRDRAIPLETQQWLVDELSPRMPVDYAVVAEAGHFTFMDVPPPNTPEPMPDAEQYRVKMAGEIADFATG